MKKWFLLLIGGVVLLVSCGNKNNTQAQIQALIDSTVNAKMAKHDAENAARNDSILKAMEKERAEAMSKEQKEPKKEENKTVKKISDSASSQTLPSH